MNYMTWLELYQYLAEFQRDFETTMDVLNGNNCFAENTVIVFKTWLAAEDVIRMMIDVTKDVTEEKKGELT